MPPAGYPTRGPWVFHSISRDFTFWPTLESISISQEHPEAVANLTCRVVDQNNEFVFVVEDELEATFNGDRIWAGILTGVAEDQLSEFGPRVWEITGEDYTTKLDDAIVRRRTKRKREKVRRRIRWLLRWLKPAIWTLDGREIDVPDTYIEKYDYFGNSVREALQQVADELRLFFYVDLDNTFHMFRTEILAAPFGLDNEAPDYVGTFPFGQFRREYDSVDLQNAVLVEPEKRRHSRWSKDTTSITAYGRQERFISDSNLGKPQQAVNVGERAIAQNKDPQEEDTLRVWEPGLRAGMRVALREVLWDHDENRIIKSVEIVAVDPHDDAGDAYLFSDLTLTDRRPARNRQGAGNKRGRVRHGKPANTDPRNLDDFTDDVAEPTIAEGTEIVSSIGNPYTVRRGVDLDGNDDGPITDDNPYLLFVQSSLGHEPAYDAPNTHRGWWEGEAWYSFTIPAHPASMAGIRVPAASLFSAQGYTASGSATVEMVVRSSAPTDIRQGTAVGIFQIGSTPDIDIPGGLIPSAGGELWVGFRPGWQAHYGAEVTGYFQWPYAMNSSQTDEDGDPYGGYSGRILSPIIIGSATWLVYSSAGGDLGTADTPDKAPFEGGWTWHDGGTEGSPVYGVDNGYLYLRSTTPTGKGFFMKGEYEDDDEPAAPWSDVQWAVEVTFSISAAGLTNQAGQRHIEVTTTGHDEKTVGYIHLGDTYYASGIQVLGPTTNDYEAFTINANTNYRALFDSRSGFMRGKIWLASQRMPANFVVESVMDETEDDADRWALWLRGGNVTGEQIIRVKRVRYLPSAARSGLRVDRELVGRADGLTKKFYVAEQFREGTLRLLVNGTSIAPIDENPDETWGLLDFWPKAGSVIRANYVVD